MSIGAIFIGLALLILTVPIVAGPVVNKRREHFSLADEPEAPAAQEKYQQVLTALYDLDFDHQLKVVSDEDYPVLRAQLLTEAAELRKAAGLSSTDDLENQIEAAVQARRNKRGSQTATQPAADTGRVCYHCHTPMDEDDKFCASCGSAAAPVCPGCGQQADPSDKFCSACGMNMTLGVMA